MMDLRDFIATTITEIQYGVQLAIDQTTDVKGAVNPIWGEGNISNDHIQEIHFDIAVTAKEQTNDQAGGGIKVMGVGVDGKVTNLSENSHVSRIQFSIPIIPTGQVILRNDDEKV